MRPDTTHGKELERDCTEAFGNLYRRFPCRWERTLDSGAAGNIVRSADSDFRLLVRSPTQGTPYLFYIECKASKSGRPFERNFRSLVKSNQNASLHAARRGGAEAFVLYRDCTKGIIQIWRAREINQIYGIKRKAMEIGPAYQFPNDKLTEFAEYCAKYPGLLLQTLESTHENRLFL